MTPERWYPSNSRRTGSMVIYRTNDIDAVPWGYRLLVENPEPDVWLGHDVFNQITQNQVFAKEMGWEPMVKLSGVYPGSTLTITAQNGEWIWRFTGEYDLQRDAFRMVWPD